MTILVRADGTPYVRPEKPSTNANIETKIAYMRAMCAYHDEIASDAGKVFAEQLGKSLRT